MRGTKSDEETAEKETIQERATRQALRPVLLQNWLVEALIFVV